MRRELGGLIWNRFGFVDCCLGALGSGVLWVFVEFCGGRFALVGLG